MNLTKQTAPRIAGIFPTHRGFGYAIFEEPDFPIEFGTTDAKGDKNAHGVAAAKLILDWYEPEVLVLEDRSHRRAYRRSRTSRLIVSLALLAQDEDIRVCRYSRGDIRACFGQIGAHNKQQIAEAIARSYPELKPHLPTARKLWMSENPRMSIFDATALVLTYFMLGERDGLPIIT